MPYHASVCMTSRFQASPPGWMLRPLTRLWILLSSESPGFISPGEPKTHLFKSSSSSFAIRYLFHIFLPSSLPMCSKCQEKERGLHAVCICISKGGTQAPSFQIPKTTEKNFFFIFWNQIQLTNSGMVERFLVDIRLSKNINKKNQSREHTFVDIMGYSSQTDARPLTTTIGGKQWWHFTSHLSSLGLSPWVILVSFVD